MKLIKNLSTAPSQPEKEDGADDKRIELTSEQFVCGEAANCQQQKLNRISKVST